MRQKSGPVKESAENVVRDIRRATRRHELQPARALPSVRSNRNLST